MEGSVCSVYSVGTFSLFVWLVQLRQLHPLRMALHPLKLLPLKYLQQGCRIFFRTLLTIIFLLVINNKQNMLRRLSYYLLSAVFVAGIAACGGQSHDHLDHDHDHDHAEETERHDHAAEEEERGGDTKGAHADEIKLSAEKAVQPA